MMSSVKKISKDILKHVGLGKEKCKTHVKEKGKFSCETCGGIVICNICITQEHTGHKIQTIMDGKKKKSEELEKYKKELTDVLPKLKEAETAVRMATKTYVENFQKKKEEIEKNYQMALKEAEEEKDKEMQKLIKMNMDMKRKENEVKRVIQIITKKQDKFTHNELCQFFSDSPNISELKPNNFPNI